MLADDGYRRIWPTFYVGEHDIVERQPLDRAGPDCRGSRTQAEREGRSMALFSASAQRSRWCANLSIARQKELAGRNRGRVEPELQAQRHPLTVLAAQAFGMNRDEREPAANACLDRGKHLAQRANSITMAAGRPRADRAIASDRRLRRGVEDARGTAISPSAASIFRSMTCRSVTSSPPRAGHVVAIVTGRPASVASRARRRR